MNISVLPSHHTDSVLCCTLQSTRNLVLSGGEDGRLCFTDAVSRTAVGSYHQQAGDAVTSVACSPADDHTALASAGSCVLHLDLRKGLGEEAVLRTYNVNADEINSIAVDPTGDWVAAGDDSGEIQVISLAQGPAASRPVYKTLRRGHSNICSAVGFRPDRPAELLSGGLDCRLVRWDFARLKQLVTWQMSADTALASSQGKVCNPPMIHALATSVDPDPSRPSLVAVARGDGCVGLYNSAYRQTAAPKVKAQQGQQQGQTSNGLVWMAGADQGGHTAAVNCVAFAEENHGKRIISAGNDSRLCVWDWEGAVEPAAAVKHTAKINWVCSVGGSSVGGVDAVLGDVKGWLCAVSFGG